MDYASCVPAQAAFLWICGDIPADPVRLPFVLMTMATQVLWAGPHSREAPAFSAHDALCAMD